MGFESAWLCPWSWTQYVPLSLEGGPLVVLGMQGGRPTHQVITWVAWEEEPLWHLLLLAMICLYICLVVCCVGGPVGTRTRTFPPGQARDLAQSVCTFADGLPEWSLKGALLGDLNLHLL